MNYLNNNIAVNLKKLRIARGWSLDVVSEQTGVSKSMLGQIERGEGNPSIGTLGKIVSGLRIELNDLVGDPKECVVSVQRDRLVPTKEVEGEYRVRNFFPYEKNRSFEIYVIEIQPGFVYFSGAHGEHTREYVLVNSGELTLELDQEKYVVGQGDAVRFDTDKNHAYWNYGAEPLELVCVFAYRT